MQTVIFLLLTFLIVSFSVLLYIKNKGSRVIKLQNGECPDCGEKAKEFIDKSTNTKFKHDVISARVLKGSSCSGRDIEFSCKSCGLKEVHTL